MNKATAFKIVDFIQQHYDAVWQEDWFELQGILLDAIADDANRGGYAKSLVEKYPYFFGEKE